ncbi:unnamed protein product [Amoebophrya sp. A120]|nr:unnamed protein product [Amoebophrya sp. A120]|eukprot:GSA120T00011141001.1
MAAPVLAATHSVVALDFSDGSTKSQKKFLFEAGTSGDEVEAVVSTKGRKETRPRFETRIEAVLGSGKTKNKLSLELVETDWSKVRVEKKKRKKMKAMKKAAMKKMKAMKKRGGRGRGGFGFGGGFFIGFGGMYDYDSDCYDDDSDFSDDNDFLRPAAGGGRRAGNNAPPPEMVLLNRDNRRMAQFTYGSIQAISVGTKATSAGATGKAGSKNVAGKKQPKAKAGAASSSSSSSSAAAQQQSGPDDLEESGTNATSDTVWVTLRVSKPGECLQTPKQNEVKQELVRMKKAFIPTEGTNKSLSFKVGFATERAATNFVNALENSRTNTKEEAAEKREELKAKKEAGLDTRKRGPLVPVMTPEQVIAQNLLRADSYAAKSIRRWNLFGPYARNSTEEQWKRYYDQRCLDESTKASEKGGNYGSECKEDDYDGELDADRFQKKIRLGLGRALVSSGKVRKEDAALLASGLFLREFHISEDGSEDPREVVVCSRIYAATANPAAVDLGFEHYHRNRIWIDDEKFMFCSALLYSPAANNPLHVSSLLMKSSLISETDYSASGIHNQKKTEKIKLCDYPQAWGNKPPNPSLGTGKNSTGILAELLGHDYPLSTRKCFSALFRAIGMNLKPATRMYDALWAWRDSKNNLKGPESLTDDEGNGIHADLEAAIAKKNTLKVGVAAAAKSSSAAGAAPAAASSSSSAASASSGKQATGAGAAAEGKPAGDEPDSDSEEEALGSSEEDVADGSGDEEQDSLDSKPKDAEDEDAGEERGISAGKKSSSSSALLKSKKNPPVTPASEVLKAARPARVAAGMFPQDLFSPPSEAKRQRLE